MKHIAPGGGAASPCFELLVRARISAREVPARTQRVLSRYACSTEPAPTALKHIGERTLGFQNSGSSSSVPQERSTRHTKPLLPFTAVSYPLAPMTRISAFS